MADIAPLELFPLLLSPLSKMEAYLVRSELLPTGNCTLSEVWEDNLALKIHDLLEAMNVKWTSTNIVCPRNPKESSIPVILWIASLWPLDAGGFLKKTISPMLKSRSKNPQAAHTTKTFDPTVDVTEPLTATLGLPICAHSTCWAEGTGGFFMAEGDDTKRLFLITARQVVFPPDRSNNMLFKHKDDSQPCHNMTLFSDAVFKSYLESIWTNIEGTAITIGYLERRIEMARRKGTPEMNTVCEAAQAKLKNEVKALEVLNMFYQDIPTQWDNPESHILGHVILSPPIGVSVSSDGYTDDWAVIKINPSKISKSNFCGNAIDLGICIPLFQFICWMCPNPHDAWS
ncbi:hypothetical protein FRC06_001039 [Ceratobasidium sp. 370]|nr:hypothetical protein FRC06_001039 [Ceratobasidium sp. 370]